MQGFTDFHLQARTKFWSWLSYMFQVRSAATERVGVLGKERERGGDSASDTEKEGNMAQAKDVFSPDLVAPSSHAIQNTRSHTYRGTSLIGNYPTP